MLSRQGLFFFPDPCPISLFALVLSGATLNQEGVEHRKKFGGTPDKESMFNIFFSTSRVTNNWVGITDIIGYNTLMQIYSDLV